MDTFLWVEQYRPKTVDDCILPQSLKNTFKEFVEAGNVPNIILSGGPGVGKTTIAKAVLDEIGATSMMVNGSEESGRLSKSTIYSTSASWVYGRVS